MVGLRESWCFCKGASKSERTKGAIFSGKSPATVRISGAGNSSSGAGFLIHRNLLLTTHANLPSVSAAETAEIRLQSGLAATLVPHRFFITSSVLDLTIVGLDSAEGDSSSQGQQQHSHYLKTCSKPSLDLGSVVYLLGFSAEKEELTVGEGKVVIATDNLIKLSPDGEIWSPGSAGFDVQGNLAFMVCDPMKLATSPPTNRSSSTTTTTTTTLSSSSSWKKEFPTQFGVPITVVIDWLNQHWEGSLDELNKPKMPIIRLMSSGQRSEHSCASFTLRRVFKPTEPDHHLEEATNPGPSPAKEESKEGEEEEEETQTRTRHEQGIPTPEIYESPKVNSVPVRKKPATSPVQLLDINFPPKVARPASNNHHPVKYLYPSSGENFTVKEAEAEASSTGSVNGAHSEVRSSGSPVEIHSEEEERETMYSAETAESRNYTSPREGGWFQQQGVGRSQSCVGHNRWAQKSPAARRALLENQRSFVQGRKVHSQGATSQRSNDYYSPTVSSIMKKRIGSEQKPISKPRQSAVVHSSPKWNF